MDAQAVLPPSAVTNTSVPVLTYTVRPAAWAGLAAMLTVCSPVNAVPPVPFAADQVSPLSVEVKTPPVAVAAYSFEVGATAISSTFRSVGCVVAADQVAP